MGIVIGIVVWGMAIPCMLYAAKYQDSGRGFLAAVLTLVFLFVGMAILIHTGSSIELNT